MQITAPALAAARKAFAPGDALPPAITETWFLERAETPTFAYEVAPGCFYLIVEEEPGCFRFSWFGSGRETAESLEAAELALALAALDF